MLKARFMCVVASLALMACGDVGGGDGSGDENNGGGGGGGGGGQASCEGTLPNGSVDVSATGDASISSEYALECGAPTGDFGILPTHAPLAQGEPVRLQLAFNRGQDWLLLVTAEVETLTPGTYTLTPSPEENHGFLNTPVGPNQPSYAMTSGTLTITDAQDVAVGPLTWVAIDGSVTAELDGVSVSVNFENVSVRPHEDE